MLDLLCKGVIGEKMDTCIAKFLGTDAAAKWFSRTLLTSSSFMAPIATFLRSKTDTVRADTAYSIVFARMELIGTVQTFNDDRKSLPSRSDSSSDKLSH